MSCTFRGFSFFGTLLSPSLKTICLPILLITDWSLVQRLNSHTFDLANYRQGKPLGSRTPGVFVIGHSYLCCYSCILAVNFAFDRLPLRESGCEKYICIKANYRQGLTPGVKDPGGFSVLVPPVTRSHSLLHLSFVILVSLATLPFDSYVL